MSFWTKARDAFESTISAIEPIDIRSESARKQKTGYIGNENRLRDMETDLVHKVTGTPTAAEKRDSARMVNDQIKAYKEQTEITRQGIAEAKAQRDIERRRVEEKQIRGLRGRSRASGLINQASPSNTSLGGSSGLPSKLGTA